MLGILHYGTRLTIVDSVFEQTDPGLWSSTAPFDLDQPASFVFEYNLLTDTDGVLIHGQPYLTR